MPESRESEGRGRSRGTRRSRAQAQPPKEPERTPEEGPTEPEQPERAPTPEGSTEPEAAERTYAPRPGLQGPSLEELEASGWVVSAPWGGHEGAAAEAAPALIRGIAAAVGAPVDRSEPIDVFSIDRAVKRPDGTVVQILRREYGFPAGRLPGDPGPVPVGFDPRREICFVLSTTAAARCLRGLGGRYR